MASIMRGWTSAAPLFAWLPFVKHNGQESRSNSFVGSAGSMATKPLNSVKTSLPAGAIMNVAIFDSNGLRNGPRIAATIL